MSPLDLLAPPRREKLHEGLAAQIRHMVASAQLQIGQKLPPERALAQRLRVSRVVVREALRSLEHAGFVEVRPGANGGAFITDNLHKSLSDATRELLEQRRLTARHFLEARGAIECQGIGLAAARARHRDLERLSAINRRLLDDLDDNRKLREHNAAFHVAIAEVSGNPLIVLMVRALMELLDVVYPRSMQTRRFIRATFRRHEAIIDAMRRRDAARCREQMAGDIGFTMRLGRGRSGRKG